MNEKEILKAIRAQQKKIGWTDYRLFKETGLTIVSGNPTLSNLVLICKALNLTIKIKS